MPRISVETRFAAALSGLQNFLIEYERKHGREWSAIAVHVFDLHGLRVSEISYTQEVGNGVYGESAMRCMPESAALILACEQFLLTYGIPAYRPEGWESDIDEHADAVFMLEQMLAGEKPSTD